MEEKILLSVIIPVYNGAAYLDKLVYLLGVQRFRSFEVLFIDDGSTDNTYQKCAYYAEKYTWIKVIHTENYGVSHARNIGIDAARGEWIHFIDADDRIHPDIFQFFYEVLKENQTDCIICGCTRKNMINGSCEACGPEENKNYSKEFFPKLFNHMDMITRYWILDYIWNKWFRKEIIDRYHIRFMQNLSLGEDFVFNTMYFQHAVSIFLLAGHYYQYRVNASGLVSKFQKEPWIGREVLYRAQERLYDSMSLLESNQEWIQRQAGQIAFGDIRTINSVKCKFNQKEKKDFIQNMMKEEQFSYLLKYLKSEKALKFQLYYWVFKGRNVDNILTVISIEKVLRKILCKRG